MIKIEDIQIKKVTYNENNCKKVYFNGILVFEQEEEIPSFSGYYPTVWQTKISYSVPQDKWTNDKVIVTIIFDRKVDYIEESINGNWINAMCTVDGQVDAWKKEDIMVKIGDELVETTKMTKIFTSNSAYSIRAVQIKEDGTKVTKTIRNASVNNIDKINPTFNVLLTNENNDTLVFGKWYNKDLIIKVLDLNDNGNSNLNKLIYSFKSSVDSDFGTQQEITGISYGNTYNINLPKVANGIRETYEVKIVVMDNAGNLTKNIPIVKIDKSEVSTTGITIIGIPSVKIITKSVTSNYITTGNTIQFRFVTNKEINLSTSFVSIGGSHTAIYKDTNATNEEINRYEYYANYTVTSSSQKGEIRYAIRLYGTTQDETLRYPEKVGNENTTIATGIIIQ